MSLSTPTPAETFALARRYHQANVFVQAEQLYRQVIQADPAHADAWNFLAECCQAQGKLDDAAACNQELLRLRPRDADARNSLANILYVQGNFEAAMGHYQEVLRLEPQSGEAHYNLANALKQLNNLDDAILCYRQALELSPNLPEAHNNLGIALRRQGRLDEAASCYERALQLRSHNPEAWTNLGNVHGDRGAFSEAMACYERALRQDPAHADAHYNRAGLRLLQGDWANGWAEYEWRWRTHAFPRHGFAQPRWDGSALAGRTLLVLAEQGLGDTLQFIRYVPLLRQRGGRVIVQCQRALRPLLTESLGNTDLLSQGEPLPAFDVFIPLLSLPTVMNTSFATVPAAAPYLRAQPALKEHWRRELFAPLGGFKVGIAWQGNAEYLGDCFRSVPLAMYAGLAEVPGVQLVSLQKGHGTEQLRALAGRFPVLDLGNRLDQTAGPFMDTAAIMDNLDLVISSDTAIVHLAGALGVPVWVALNFVPDWRWLLHQLASPWYPTMQLFRQTRQGNWEDVFQRMADQLRARVSKR